MKLRCRDMVGQTFVTRVDLWRADGCTKIPKGTRVTVDGTWNGLFHVVAPDRTYVRMVPRGDLIGCMTERSPDAVG